MSSLFLKSCPSYNLPELNRYDSTNPYFRKGTFEDDRDIEVITLDEYDNFLQQVILLFAIMFMIYFKNLLLNFYYEVI